jgi:hypothetical protein
MSHTVCSTGNWVGCALPASHQGESVNGSWVLLTFKGHEAPSHYPEAFTPSRFRLYMYPFHSLTEAVETVEAG